MTAQAVKASINAMVDRMGQRDSWRYHFMVHQFVEQHRHRARREPRPARSGGMDAVRSGEQARPHVTGPLEGMRVLDLGTRIAAPFCAGCWASRAPRSSRSSSPGRGDFMREIGPFVATEDDGPGYSLFWAVEGRGRQAASPSTCASPRARTCSAGWPPRADVVVENFRPGTLERWDLAPGELDPRLVVVRIGSFGQDGPYAQRPGLDRLGIGYGGLLHLTGYPDRPPVRVGVTTRDYLTGVFAAQAAVAALYAARRAWRDRHGAVIDAALYGSVLRILEWTLAGLRPAGHRPQREGNRLANSAPLDNYPTADGRYVCIVAGLGRQLRPAVRGHGPPRAGRRSPLRASGRPGRPRRRDQRHRGGLDPASTAAEVEAAAVAHDVPVATAYTAADIAADPHMAARGDLVRSTIRSSARCASRRRSPLRRRGPAPCRRAPPASASTPERCSAATLGVADDELDRLAARRRHVSGRQVPVHAGLFETTRRRGGAARVALPRRAAGTSSRRRPPARRVGATTSRPVRLSSTGTLWGWTAVHTAPPGLRGARAVRVRRRRAPRGAARHHPARGDRRRRAALRDAGPRCGRGAARQRGRRHRRHVHVRAGPMSDTVRIAGVGMHPVRPVPRSQRHRPRACTAVPRALAEAGDPAFDAAFCGTAYAGVAAGHKVLGALGRTGMPIVDIEAGCASAARPRSCSPPGRSAPVSTRRCSSSGIEKMPKGIIRSSFFEPWREEAGLAATPAYFALRAQRLQREAGVTKEQLAAVVVKNRRHGVAEPRRDVPQGDDRSRRCSARGSCASRCTSSCCARRTRARRRSSCRARRRRRAPRCASTPRCCGRTFPGRCSARRRR